jgi:translation initiation factor 2B subunit (eIF-2B alpha/beta/delta family)
MLNLDALVSPLRADVVSGAAVVSRTAAEVVRRVAVRAPAETTDDLRRVLEETAVRVLDAQPSMAPVVTLLVRVFRSLEGDPDLDEARRRVARVAEAFREELQRATERAGRHLSDLLDDGDRVLTLSDSSTVRAGLIRAAEEGALEVVCLESRPLGEGVRLARALSAVGIPVTVAVDAAMSVLLEGCRAVLLGADSVGDAGIVNKVGSVAAARCALAAGVPVWVVTDRTKFLPSGFPQPLDDDRPADEVCRPPGDAKVWNRYFELLPFDLVQSVVTDDGPLDPLGLSEERHTPPLPAELARWAARRAGGAMGGASPRSARRPEERHDN